MHSNTTTLGIVRHIASGILLVLAPFICVMCSFAQNNNKCELLDQRISFRISNGTFVYALARLVRDYEIPIGLEKSSQHIDDRKININVENNRLEEVLELLVKQSPEYEWKLIDCVVNFSPRFRSKSFTESFLALQITQINYPEDNDKDSFIDRVLELSEVTRLMKSNRIKYAWLLNEPSNSPLFPAKRSGVFLSNVSIRRIFNRVIKESQQKSWVLEMAGDKNNMLLISF